MGKSDRRELRKRDSSDEESDEEDYIPGRPAKPITGAEHAEKYGDKRVSMLDVLKKVRPRSPVTKALEEKATRDEGDEDGDDAEMEPFTEDDYLHARDTAISKILPPAERRHKAQVASLAERAARRAERDGAPEPVAEGTRRSTRLQTDISYAESSPETPSPVDSSPGFKSSDKSESYSPSPRGIKRKRTTKDKDEEVKPGAKRRNTKRVIDSDEEMKDITSRSRSVTPAPPIKKHSKRVTTLVDSDDEMDESPTGRVSTSRSRSATPAPPVKKRKVEGKRVTTLADSDEEIE